MQDLSVQDLNVLYRSHFFCFSGKTTSILKVTVFYQFKSTLVIVQHLIFWQLKPLLKSFSIKSRLIIWSSLLRIELALQIALRNLLSEQYNSDLEKWRSAILAKKTLSRDYAEGFQMMDMDNGALWDLTKRLMAYDPSKRLSAAAALRHEAFGRGAVGQLNVVLARASAAVDKVRRLTCVI